ncbi:PAS-domain containing protein [Litorivita sp. NS0012-18]
MTLAGLNLIQQALSIYDRDLRLVQCNRPFQEMFDLPDDLCRAGADFGETIRYLVTHGEYGEVDDIEAFVQVRIEDAKAFEPHYFERTRSNGRTLAIEGSPLPDGGWVTVYTDITRTKRQEALLRARAGALSEEVIARAEELSAANRQLESTVQALEEAKRQLTLAEARSRLTAEMMPAHIAHVDRDDIYTYTNRRLGVVMPGRPTDIVGLHISQALGAVTYEAISPHLEAAHHGKASVFEFTDVMSSRRLRVAFTPDHEDGGVYLLSMDITEETQTRHALQQTRRREMAAQMTSGLAHDFSNLLTIILGMQARLGRMQLPPQAGELIEATLSAARRGGALLNSIADMTGARAVHPVATDMSGFFDDLGTLARSTLPDDVTLEISNLIPAPRLMLDPGMVQDCLINLVLNARDAIRKAGRSRGHSPGRAQGRIVLTAAPVTDTWVDFTLRDNGTGFSAEALERAFDPFFTTKGGEGSGLGLAMVYDTAKLSGGRVALANTDEGGEVTLRLPLRPAPAPTSPGLVLLVEDSPDLRRSIRAMLVDQGHAVIESASAEEARIIAAEVPQIAFILSDITLEGGATGNDLLDQLPPQAPPCYLMTSLPPEHPDHQRAIARVPVLQKPFSAEQLAGFLDLRQTAPAAPASRFDREAP